MYSRKVTFHNAAGVQLAGRLDLPENGRTPRAWAMFAHCFTCGKSLTAISQISRALNAEDIGLLRFDFTGLGESEGEFSTSSLSSNRDDLVAAARWLEEEYQAPALLIGHSFGGAAVLQAAALLPATLGVVTIAAPFDPEHVTHLLPDAVETIRERGSARVILAGREFTIGRTFLDDLATHRTSERLARLDRALLVMHSPRDQTVDIENARLIYQSAVHPKSFISLADADHLLTDKRDARYAGRLIAVWAERYLQRGGH